MNPTQAQALEALIAECETANKRAVDEIGIGLIDLNVISRPRSAIESPSSTVMDEKGERELDSVCNMECDNCLRDGRCHASPRTAPAPSAAEPVALGWTSQEIIEACDATGIDDRTFRRLMSALKVLDKRTRAPALPRPDDDALWDKTLKERDDYHEWADRLAERISTITGVDIGEHSSANNPWQNAVNAADEFNYGRPQEAALTAPAPSAAAPVTATDRPEPPGGMTFAAWTAWEAANPLPAWLTPAQRERYKYVGNIAHRIAYEAWRKSIGEEVQFNDTLGYHGDWNAGRDWGVWLAASLAAPPAPQPTEAETITPASLAQAAGVKVLPILKALEAAGWNVTVNAALAPDQIGSALALQAEAPVAEPVAQVEARPNGDKLLTFCGGFDTTSIAVGTKLYTHPAPSAAEDAKDDPIRALIAHHAALLDQSEYTYFELAYTRQTGWMAFVTDKPLAYTVVNPDRKVLAHGQGDSPDEACRAAMAKEKQG